MNILKLNYLLITLTVLLSGCGQTGRLYMPNHGDGYYRTHEFTARPVTAGPEKSHHHTKKKASNAH